MEKSEASHATGPALTQPDRLPVVVDGLSRPFGLAVSAQTGDVFVANSGANTVIRIPRSLASGGGGQSQTLTDPRAHTPKAVAITRNGDVVVVNESSASVSVFSSAGNYLRTITSPLLKSPMSVAISPVTGDAFVPDYWSGTVVRIPASRLAGGQEDLDPITDSSFYKCGAVAVSGTGDVFVANAGGRDSVDNPGCVSRIPASRAAGGEGKVTTIGGPRQRVFQTPQGIAIGRNGDVLVANSYTQQEGFVTRIPAARASGKNDALPLDLITSPTLTSPIGGAMHIAISPFTGDAYVTNRTTNTVVFIPAARVAGGSGTPQAIENLPSISGPQGIAVSPVTGDVFVANQNAGSVTRIIKGIEVVGAEGEGQFYTVPPAVSTVALHTEGGFLDGGTGLDLHATLPVSPGEQFYLINQYNAAYIFHRRTSENAWEPLLVSGGAGTGPSVQTEGVPRSDGNGTIYPGNGGGNFGAGGGGWGGGAASGDNTSDYGNAEAGSGSKGGDSGAGTKGTRGKGGLYGADGADVGVTGGGRGGEGEVSLTMDAAAFTFTLSGGNSHPTGYYRGGAGYSAGGNCSSPGLSGAGSGYAANMLVGKVTATSAPATNGNSPTTELIPG